MSSQPAVALPGPRFAPIMGAQVAMMHFMNDAISFMMHLYHNHGNVAAFDSSQASNVGVFGAEANQQVLGRSDLFHTLTLPFKAPPDSMLQRLLISFPIQEGVIHRTYRNGMQPMFSRQYINALSHVNMLVSSMLDQWQIGTTKNVCVDFGELLLQLTLKLIFEGVSQEEGRALLQDLEHWLNLASNPVSVMLPFATSTLPYGRLLSLSEKLAARYRRYIAEERAQPGTHKVIRLLLDLQQENSQTNDLQLLGHIHMTLMATEPTAHLLAWALFLLAQHPQVASDLRDEIDGKLHGAMPSPHDLESLPLLQRVISESLRLMPPAIFLSRVARAPSYVAGYPIEAGTHVICSPFVSHRIPEVFVLPNRFMPDRWLNNSVPTYAYIPFGMGVHTCVASHFAQVIMRMLIAQMLQRFTFRIAPNALIERKIRISLVPKYGMPLQLLPRSERFMANPVKGNVHEIVALAD